MNNLLLNIAPHPSKRISDAVRGRLDVLDLTVGVPDYGPPKIILDRIAKYTSSQNASSATFNKYADSRGVHALRCAIAEKYHRRYEIAVNPDTEVLITNGGAEAIWLTIFAVTNAGDSVLMPDPCYMLYEPIVRSLGRQSVRIKTDPNNNFILQAEDISKVLTERVKLVLLNSPANPTGSVLDGNTLNKISELCCDNGVYIMHDEVFDDVVFEGVHTPLLKVARCKDRAIMVNSFSKRFGMTGWRLGWLVASSDVITQTTKAHTFTNLATGALTQESVVPAINDDAVQDELSMRVASIGKRAYEFSKALATIPGFECSPPSGGFYLFPRVTEFYNRFAPKNAKPVPAGDAVSEILLNKCKIAVVPGSAFGAYGEEHIRISFVASETELNEAIKRLRDYSELN